MRKAALSVVGALALMSGTVATANAVVPHGSGTESIAALRAEALHGTLDQTHGVYMACAARHMTCQYGWVTQNKGTTSPLFGSSPIGLGADVLENAYGLKNAKSSKNTVAIIGAAYFDPKVLESSLNTYREQYGLGDCTIASGCLTVTGWNSNKLKPAKTDKQKQAAEGVGLETSLDVEMVSAACPSCKIVELQTPWGDGYYHPNNPQRDELSDLHFGTAVQRAVKTFGATAVSMSYGLRMDSTTATNQAAKDLDIKGVGIFASTGDSGYDGYFTDTSAWPEGLTTVAAVGGTVLPHRAAATPRRHGPTGAAPARSTSVLRSASRSRWRRTAPAPTARRLTSRQSRTTPRSTTATRHRAASPTTGLRSTAPASRRRSSPASPAVRVFRPR